jgi:hypothetical protein
METGNKQNIDRKGGLVRGVASLEGDNFSSILPS